VKQNSSFIHFIDSKDINVHNFSIAKVTKPDVPGKHLDPIPKRIRTLVCLQGTSVTQIVSRVYIHRAAEGLNLQIFAVLNGRCSDNLSFPLQALERSGLPPAELMFEQMSLATLHTTKLVVEFAKELPSFGELHDVDKIAVLKVGDGFWL
jgi:hypothetical protein